MSKTASWSWDDVLPAGSFTVHRHRNAQGRPCHPKREEALDLVRSGKTYAEVAQQLGLTRSQVAGFCYRANG